MPLRPFPEDTPDRETTWRRGIVRTRIRSVSSGFAYIVDFEQASGGGTELAFGIASFAKGAFVNCQWRNESGIWWVAS